MKDHKIGPKPSCDEMNTTTITTVTTARTAATATTTKTTTTTTLQRKIVELLLICMIIETNEHFASILPNKYPGCCN